MSVVVLDVGVPAAAIRLLQRAAGKAQVVTSTEVESTTSADVLVVPTLEQVSPEQVNVLWRLLIRHGVGQLWLANMPCVAPHLPPSLTWESGQVDGLKARLEFLPDCTELQINIRTAFHCPLGQPLIETVRPPALTAWAYRPTSNSGQLFLSTLDLLRHSPFTREQDRQCVLETLITRLLAEIRKAEPLIPAVTTSEIGPPLDDALLNAVILGAALTVNQGGALTLESLRETLSTLMGIPLDDHDIKAGLAWLEKQALDLGELVTVRGLEPFLRRFVR